MNKENSFLSYKAYAMRVSSLVMTTAAGSGHPTSALSCADLVAALFFYAMRYDLSNPDNPANDRLVLSKGHASPILYAAYKELGVLSDADLAGYRSINSPLEGHPTKRFSYTEAATGSLGMGLSVGLGMRLAARQQGYASRIFVLMGDSEVAEGQIWEAAELAAYYKASRLVGIIDCNRLGQTGPTMHEHHVQRYADKFEAFGWKTLVIDGHDMQQIMHALEKAAEVDDKPVMIIAKTIKGYGLHEVEDKNGFHGKAFTKEELKPLLDELARRFPYAAAYDARKIDYTFPTPSAREPIKPIKSAVQTESHACLYKKDSSIATRKAYGEALRGLGGEDQNVVSLDAEVSNSTYAEFFAQKYPERFYNCFIAEQNMVSMAVGFARLGTIPFVSTFGAFMSRAHDQIRMAAVGNSPLRLVGSHAGVSIGEDGPSQMALEDIALMRALPESVVLYPSDGVATAALVKEMASYDRGISYLRTTRMATPVIYDVNEQFPIGGCKIVRQNEQDKVCIVAAGVTLFEALRAMDMLSAEGVSVSVIDLYSIKPLDVQTLTSVAQSSGNTIITVEDHYREGGMGEAVASALSGSGIAVHILAVTQLPRSGKPEELLAWAGIDAATIVTQVKHLAAR
jgi:transketolase